MDWKSWATVLWEVREEGEEVEGVNYHGAKQAITLAMRAEDLMFACGGDFFF